MGLNINFQSILKFEKKLLLFRLSDGAVIFYDFIEIVCIWNFQEILILKV